MGFLKNIENKVQRWLFSEEIETLSENPELRPQSQPQFTQEEVEAEVQRVREIHERELETIKGEDHSQPPSDGDIQRYYNYHSNMVENINMIREHTGQEPPWDVPRQPVNINEFAEKAGQEGWKYLRMSCGLPTGDLNKPKKPWTMADTEKKWIVDEEPEIHWKTKD